MGDIGNLTAAVRAALQAESQRDDMRAIARQAASHLPEDLLIEAAITHLTRLARQIHNQEVREHGSQSAVSQEVVWTRGGDTFLGETTDADREFLIANREALAAGLQRRAEAIRQFGAAGPSMDLTSRDVLALERQADAVEHMRDMLAIMATPDSDGRRPSDRESASRILDANQRRDAARERSRRYRAYAENLGPSNFIGGSYKRTRRAAIAMARVFEGDVDEG